MFISETQISRYRMHDSIGSMALPISRDHDEADSGRRRPCADEDGADNEKRTEP